MADMSDVLDVLTDIENYLVDLPTKIILRANQIFIVNGLSDVSENLGIVTAGEFRAGNRNEPGMFLRTAVAGSGFSGMRMAYPAMSYDLDGTATDWNLVGINDDILQFGVRASDGKLVAGGGAVILDEDGITAVGGTIAGWTIDTTELTNTKIKISSAGSIESIPFVSGVGGSGWKISEGGNVEFNNAVIRGELRTTVLTYQEVQAVSGTMGVFHSAGVLSQDLTLPAVPSGTYPIRTKAPNSTNPKIFDVNHILQIKNGTQSTWFIIDGGYETSGDGYSWFCTYLSGTTDVTYTVGQAVISYGVSGDGFLLMEAIGTGAPYFSVRTHAGAPYTATTEHVRMGNLNGGWGYATDIYGVAIGQYAAGKGNITVDPTDGIKINIHTDNIMQFNSSGAFITNVLNMTGDDAAIAIGATPPTSSSAGTGLWLDKTGLFSLDTNTHQVKIDATDGKLYAGGGSVTLDDDGITLFSDTSYTPSSSIEWYRGTVRQSVITTYDVLSKSYMFMYAGDPGNYPGAVRIAAYADTSPRITTQLLLNSDGTAKFESGGISPTELTLEGNLTVTNPGFSSGNGNIFVDGGIILKEGSTPSTPASGQVSLYAKDGGLLYTKDDLGIEKFVGGYFDGWIPINIAPVYVSATSIRFENIDLSGAFPIGTKIKFTQTTVKYFYVIAASYSGGHTDLTVTGGSSYSVANAAISDFAYAHGVANGFPEWFSCAFSSVSASGSMTVSSVTYPAGNPKFKIDGTWLTLKFRVDMTLGGTASTIIYLNGLPVPTISGAGTEYIGAGMALTINRQCWLFSNSDDNAIRVFKYDFSNFTLGSSVYGAAGIATYLIA